MLHPASTYCFSLSLIANIANGNIDLPFCKLLDLWKCFSVYEKMAPKIEELPDDYHNQPEQPVQEDLQVKPPIKKNPFAAKRGTMMRRNPDEVYPERRGLNKLDYLGDKPLDLLFQKLEKILESPYDEITIEQLSEKIFHGQEQDQSCSRYNVIKFLMDQLIQVQEASLESRVGENSSLITISLHDLKTFGKLVNTIVILGVYPALSAFHIGIPFAKRKLKDTTDKSRPAHIAKLEPSPAMELLLLLYEKFYILFQTRSDVTDLLSKGTGFTDFLTIAIALITIPRCNNINNKNDNKNGNSEEQIILQFRGVEKIAETYELLQTYSLLLTTPSPSYFKQFVMQKIQTLPYDAPRGDGLLTLIEYVLGLREQEDIDITKFDQVANVVLLKPKEIKTTDYFTSIGKQSYNLLVNINRPHVASCVTYIMEKLWERNKLVVNDFFLQQIWRVFEPREKKKSLSNTKNENLLVLVSEKEFNNGINVLISISRKGLEASLYHAVMEPVILPLWGYYLFLKKNGKSVEIISTILTSYFTVIKDFDENSFTGVDKIRKNLLFDGGNEEKWKYEVGANGLPQIVKRTAEFTSQSKEVKLTKFIEDIDFACTNFVTLLKDVDDEIVHAIFIETLKQWLSGNKGNGASTSPGAGAGAGVGSGYNFVLGETGQNPFIKLMDLKVLEGIGETFKESLARTPHEMLTIVYSFLENLPDEADSMQGINTTKDADSDDEGDENFSDENEKESLLPVLLELLSAILTESDVVIDKSSSALLLKIKTSLSNIMDEGLNSNVKSSAEALQQRITNLLSGEIATASNEIDAQKTMLSRAITSLNDPLVPIRAHGLYLLRQLVEMRSEVISLDFVINLHLVQLKDPEPYIYLNVIKGLGALIEWEEIPVLKILCGLYRSKDTELDERLRIGEVLLKYIQLANETFAGESAELVVESTLSVIRTHDEDNRIRMSAMSLLGICCKVHPLGLIGHLEAALDCAIGILNLETSKEQAIMRRAAVMLIQDLIIGTSETDKVEFPKKYQRQISTLLKYVEHTDNDIFVREQIQNLNLN